MKVLKYISDKNLTIVMYLLNLLLTIILLALFNTKKELIIIISELNIIVGIMIILINYFRKKSFYENIEINLSKLDKKYLVLETMPEPTTYEEKIIKNIMYEINKSMIEEVKSLEKNNINFKEFVEMWIHEVKIPISSLILKCHNNHYANDLQSQIRKLDNYIDEVLYYVRSENAEKDFTIKETYLANIIRNVSLKNKDDLLENKIDLEISNVKYKVYTDSKWLEFILNQIINNCIKYKKDINSKIKMEATEIKDCVTLSIYDNGIGIPKKDINRVFEKTFTGENGRNKVKSTGMGLYISKQLCDKLGHDIKVQSKENEYTEIIICFKNNDFYRI